MASSVRCLFCFCFASAAPLRPPRVIARGAGFVELEVALTSSLALIVREADVGAQDGLVERAVSAAAGVAFEERTASTGRGQS
jgi:hypothetical protein